MAEAQSLVAALTKSQAEFPEIGKNQENPHFKSKYADLAAVLAAVRPTLAKNGLALVQLVGENEHGTVLVTKLLHESGELVSTMPLAMDGLTSQQVGSLLTYSRRYACLAICGVHPADEDDDGTAATEAGPQRGTSRSGASGGKPASEAQVKFAKTLMTDVVQPAAQLSVIAEHGKRELSSIDDLATLQSYEISPLIEWLKEQKKAGVTAGSGGDYPEDEEPF